MALTKVSYAMIQGSPANVLDFGADATGTTDSTAAFNAALSASSSVFVPAGTYLVENITEFNSGCELFGEGFTSILKLADTTPDSHILDINHNTFVANIDGLYVHDLQLQGETATPVFEEQCHLVALTGVTNALFENVKFYAFSGDGMYIGSGDSGVDEYHNSNITVSKCVFDGVNKENRNGVSVIDCNNLLIDNCYFANTTKSTMPGAIDIEPNANVYHVVKNITVSNCRFYNIGGNFGVIGVLLSVAFTTAATGFSFENNFIEASGTGFNWRYDLTGGVAESANSFGLDIINNTVKDCTGSAFRVTNVRDCCIQNNEFNVCNDASFISYDGSDYNAIDVTVTDNLFYKNGATNGNGLSIFKSTRVTITGNEFNDCGTGVPGAANAIDFNTGTSSNITVSNNNFVSPTGKTTVAIQKEAAHTFTPAGNIQLNNRFSGLTNYFNWRIGDPIYASAAPASEAWVINDRVYNSAPAAGQPEGWVCTVAGTPGTWKAMSNLA